MYARTVRKLILLVAAVVAVLGLLAGWRFTVALAGADTFEAPSDEPIMADESTSTAPTLEKAWFSSIGGLGGAISAPLVPVKPPAIKFTGCAVDPDPAFTTAVLQVAGKTVWAKKGKQVAGGTVKDINEERILFEHGGTVHEIPLEKRDYSKSPIVPVPPERKPGARRPAKPIKRLPPKKQP